MSDDRPRLIRTDLTGVEEHIAAMIDAETPSACLAVLQSALRTHLGGQFVTCNVHGGHPMTFAELHTHTARDHHAHGDVIPAEPDPIEVRRMGGDR